MAFIKVERWSWPRNSLQFLNISRLIVLMIYIDPSFAANSSIATSSDVWAALVANIAPLLVLVGEKHVKAYFKIMCRTSHHLLYAAGPIGLVTAITTLVRLNGSPLLKRIIGRQFETRAEVLADVTSVTAGDVCLELKNGKLEQTTNPDPQDWAQFYVHGKKVGGAQVALDYAAGFRPIIGSIAYGAVVTTSQQYMRKWGWGMVASFRAVGDDAPVKTRKVAEAYLSGSSSFEDGQDAEELRATEACVAVYAAWTDVSFSLTASHCLDHGLTDVMRLAVVLTCILADVAVIAMNWVQQRDNQNCALVAAGVAISVLGSFITARLVDAASDETTIDLTPLSATRAGFYSERIAEGTELSFCPEAVVISSVATMRPERKRLVGILSHCTVVVMTLGYIALYLGLRTSLWWAPLALLLTFAVASVARAYFVPDELELLKSGDPSPFPFGDVLDTISARGDLLFKDEGSTPIANEKDPKDTSSGCQSGNSNTGTPGLPLQLSPARVGPTYETVAYRCAFSQSTVPCSLDNNRFFIAAVLAIVIRLRRHSSVGRSVPVEFTESTLTDTTGQVLYSDLLGRDGVWRQPLEIMVSAVDMYSANPMDEFLIPLKAWYWRAEAVRARGFAKKISSQNLETELNERGRNNQFPSFGDDAGSQIGEAGCLWMAVKIAFVVFGGWTTSRLEQFLVANLDAQRDSMLSEAEQQSLLECLKVAGLVVVV
ncbi:hypothetical protein BZA05DRAFT_106487 [Tricharina praecox]|uniref:uncharacterized protein n=1 Tax=Tricharina praecox TaxID=43433 RepID=UPI002221001D|nr:uncharacterized protein BZA05DRAFT_106487 [Tricharina praecox]KAI5857798.1 hypothetical protein BZA05DRAFT_106487 [Tricharina praecox]